MPTAVLPDAVGPATTTILGLFAVTGKDSQKLNSSLWFHAAAWCNEYVVGHNPDKYPHGDRDKITIMNTEQNYHPPNIAGPSARKKWKENLGASLTSLVSPEQTPQS